MKSTIAALSIGLSVAFALALANAGDDSASSPSVGSDISSSAGQQAGISGDEDTMHSTETSATRATQSPSGLKTTETQTSQSKQTVSNTCTDKSGVTFSRRDTGFKNCQNKALQGKSLPDQAAGTVGDDSTAVNPGSAGDPGTDQQQPSSNTATY